MASKFIYIDGTEIRQSPKEPTEDDLQDCLDGDIQILKVNGESISEAQVSELEEEETELSVEWSELDFTR